MRPRVFKEILWIVPKLSANDLNAMQRALSTRFGTIAKKFGKGILAALTGGGLTAIALGLVDKVLNPLKETQEAIDRVLKSSDDIVTNAKQFGTQAGTLARLQARAKATGLDAGSLDVLIQKFQAAVAEAVADPNKETSVRKFVGQKDSALAFFSFIQGLQKLNKTQQVLVQQEVFGEKQILKMADFLQTDFSKQNIGGPDEKTLTEALTKLGDLNDLSDLKGAVRELDDFVGKAAVIKQKNTELFDKGERERQKREDQNIANYQNLKNLSLLTEKISGQVEQLSNKVGEVVPTVTGIYNNLGILQRDFKNSRIGKGILKLMGKE